MAKKLTPKQKRFCEEYIADLNASAAALRAGYKHPDNGRQLLTKTHVSTRIVELKAARSERTEVTADMVIKELSRLGFSDMREFASWGGDGVSLKPSGELSDDAAACVSQVHSTRTVNRDRYGNEVETENTTFKLHDKKGSLELLGRHLGIFKDNLNVTGDRPFVVQVKGLSRPVE